MASQVASALEEKYAEERDKRLRPDGFAQYVDLRQDAPGLAADPWIDYEALASQEPALKDGDDVQFLITGAGHISLLFAGRLVEAGFDPKGICLVDTAGGFGGTWYWNRFPGLTCDVEGYIYLPFLEETGYVPKQKYSSGEEIRQHCERVAAHFNLRGLFSTTVLSQVWDESKKRWVVKMQQNRGPGREKLDFEVTAQFVYTGSGLFTSPKAPKVPGFEDFRRSRHVFHPSRWDYEYTGGSPVDPSLVKLKDKVVGIVGTGATSVQIVPEVAKWAKHLYVFQRTPSYCTPRPQAPTNPEAWSSVASGKGWQKARRHNFDKFTSNDPEPVDLINDGWTEHRSFAGLVGGPKAITPQNFDEYAKYLFELDVERAEKVRAHVEQQVQDPTTAEKLKAWYPGWCKRPTFHSEYLPTFNRANVTLVDTQGQGLERFTARGVVVDGVEHELDLMILSTGYGLATGNEAAPGFRNGITVVGRGGRHIQEKWGAADFGTFHGVLTHDFPNMIIPGLSGAVGSANLTSTYDMIAQHAANILKTAAQRASDPKSLVVEPSKQAENEWTTEVQKRAIRLAIFASCTPGYFNHEGTAGKKSLEQKMLDAKRALWGDGIFSWQRIVEEYDAKGDLEGIEVSW
ncbi:putative monooxygenase [Phyllosticta citribraziliensis]|uniref:Monooxygenase n=1 Tax=Phyllosticta citribraziliensis TaxID=989973 RepID=A0ABR1LZS1_9PEZI